jgi:hypothetical protein
MLEESPDIYVLKAGVATGGAPYVDSVTPLRRAHHPIFHFIKSLPRRVTITIGKE